MRYLLCLLLCWAPLLAAAQALSPLDSLRQKLGLQTAAADSLRVLDAGLLSASPNKDTEAYLGLAERYRALAAAAGTERSVARSVLCEAIAYRHLGNEGISRDLLREAELLYGAFPNDPDWVRLYNCLSNVHILLGHSDSALIARQQELVALRKTPNATPERVGMLLTKIAYLAVYAGRMPVAAEFNEQARRLAADHPATPILAEVRANQALIAGVREDLPGAIAILRSTLGDSSVYRVPHQEKKMIHSLAYYYNANDQRDSAVFYAEMNLKHVDPKVNPTLYFSSLSDLGTSYFELDQAEDLLRIVKTYERELANNPVYSSTSQGESFSQLKALVSIQQGDREEATRFIAESVASVDDTTPVLRDAEYLRKAAKLSKINQDYERAVAYLERAMKVESTVISNESMAELNRLEKKYASLEKDNQLKEQALQITANERRSAILFTAVGLLIFLLVFSAIILYQRNQRNQLLQRQKEELEKLDTAKSRFFVNITHELRTPLSLILAPLEQARALVKSAAVRKQIDLAYTNGQRLLALVDEMLDLSKLESGQMRLHPTPVHLQVVLKRIFFSFHSIANVRGILLSFQYNLMENLWLEIDLPKFEKIVNNLLSNAVKYSEHGGVVTLKVTPLPVGRFQVTVQDTGRGIPPAEREKVFERFYQVDGEDYPLQGGTGIGLALSRELAQALGGTLELTSELGIGSEFTVTLPLNKTAAASANPEDPEQTPGHTFSVTPAADRNYAYASANFSDHRPTVLIVEDNPEMANFLEELLGVDYLCTVTYNGLEALKKLEHSRYDLIVSDLMMPHIDGYTLREELLSDSRYDTIPFIFLTARNFTEDRLRGLRLGVDDYLTKPFNGRELRARIDNLISNAAQRKVARQESKEEGEEVALSADRQRLADIEALVLNHLDDRGYGVDQLAKEVAYSRRQLARIIKKETGLTPAKLIQEIRLQHAYRSIQNKEYHTIAEVAMSVGFEDPSYFSKVFGKRFGKKPREVSTQSIN